jgi:hypothetical protein
VLEPLGVSPGGTLCGRPQDPGLGLEAWLIYFILGDLLLGGGLGGAILIFVVAKMLGR